MAAGISLQINVDDNASAKVKAVSSRFDELKKKISGGSTQIRSGFRKIQEGAGGLTRSFSQLEMAAKLALGAAAAAAVFTGASFEQGMAKVQAVTGTTKAELQSLEVVARDLGATTAFSAKEASDAMFSLASAGKSLEEIKAITPHVLNLAGALDTGLGPAAELVVKTLNQFRMGSDQAARVANVMAAANRNSTMTFERLSDSLRYAGTVADSTGLSLEQTVALLALVVDSGLEATQAGTALRSALATLAAPNEKLQALLGGVSMQADGLGAVLDKLKGQTFGVEEAVKGFDKEVAAAMLTLVRAGSEGFESLTQKITGTNQAAEQYRTMMDTVSGDAKIMKAALEENFIAVFKAMAPEMRAAQQGIIKGIQDIKPYMVGIVKWTVGWISENKELIFTTAKIYLSLFAIHQGIGLVVKGIGLVSGAVKIVMGTIQVAIGVVRVLRTAWLMAHAAMIGPWGLVAVLVAAVIGGLIVLVYRFRDKIKEVMGNVWEAVKDIWGKIYEKIKDVIIKAAGWIAKLIPGFDDFVANGIEKMEDLAAGAADAVMNGGEIIGSEVTEWVAKIKGAVAGGLEEMKKMGQAAGGVSAAAPTPAPAFETILEVKPIIPESYKAQTKHIAKATSDEMEAANMRITASSQMHTDRWLKAREGMITAAMEREISNTELTEAQKAQIEIQASMDILEARKMHQDALLDHYMQTHQAQMLALSSLEAGYEAFYVSLFDKEMTWQQRQTAIWESMKRAFINNTLAMTKAWIGERLKAIAIGQAAEQQAQRSNRFAEAKIGAVKAYQAFAAIPIIGPALGAAAAAAAFSFLMAFQKGGLVPGTGSGDRIAAALEPGEFVITKAATRAIGIDNLSAINRTGALPANNGQVINLIFPIDDKPEEDAFIQEIEQEIAPVLEDLFRRRRLFKKRVIS